MSPSTIVWLIVQAACFLGICGIADWVWKTERLNHINNHQYLRVFGSVLLWAVAAWWMIVWIFRVGFLVFGIVMPAIWPMFCCMVGILLFGMLIHEVNHDPEWSSTMKMAMVTILVVGIVILSGLEVFYLMTAREVGPYHFTPPKAPPAKKK